MQTKTQTTPQDIGPSYLAAFLLALFTGLTGGHRLYTGHTSIAVTQIFLLVAPLIVAPLLLLDLTIGLIAVGLALLLTLGAFGFWYIDLWIYFLGNVRHKKTGLALVRTSAADTRYARAMMLGLHVAGVLLAVGITALLAAASFFLVQMTDQLPLPDPVQLQQAFRELGY